MPQAVDITVAGLDDAGALALLRATWSAGDEVVPEETQTDFERSFRTWMDREGDHRIFWLARAGAEPVGMVNLQIFDRMPVPDRSSGAWGYLGNLFVVPTVRGQGVGRRLVDAVLTFADARELARVVLHPTPASRTLYERGGFEPAVDLMRRQRS